MNIIIFGAGAIGSLFGALLSKNNNVTLIGRKNHVNAIKKYGLSIKGITKLNLKIEATDSGEKVKASPDLLILTVKSYDTDNSIKQASNIIREKTTVLSLQNGLDNVDSIKKYLEPEKIIAGVTTHGAFFSKPGEIQHTGKGTTVLGELNGKKTEQLNEISSLFNQAGIKTITSQTIIKDIWSKAIVNSCINPLTTFFQCKNGYLLGNPILEHLVQIICEESINIANTQNLDFSYNEMINHTRDVIINTSENYSSMVQSYKKDKRTEIDSINGKLVKIGKNNGVDVSLNEMLVNLIKEGELI
jgi:2-dehydropantoate 2-reductase